MAAVSSASFPFKGSDSNAYTGQTLPLSGGGQAAVDTVVQVVPMSRSGTITTGGAAQMLASANTARRGFVIQNQSAADLYFTASGTATLDQNSFRIEPGAVYATDAHHVSTGQISIVGATTGQAFYAREF